MRDDRERLFDILEAIERIDKYASKGRPAFEDVELIQTWVLHHLQLIGEATRALSTEVKQRHPEAPCAQIAGMRNILVHEDFGIDTCAVANFVEVDLPAIKRQIAGIRAE